MEKIKSLFELNYFVIALVLGVYLISLWVYKKTRLSLFHPVLLSVAVLIVVLKLFDVEYETFQKSSELLNVLLDLCVVALGYVLYEQVEHIRTNLVSITISVFVGSAVGIISVVGILYLFNVPESVQASLAPKSVTTPIAIRISELMGGMPSLTAVVVVFVGIFGSIIGPIILKILKIKSKIAKGLAMGTSAHGIGTARAIEMGAIEGAISGLAIGLMGIFTAILVPLFNWILNSTL